MGYRLLGFRTFTDGTPRPVYADRDGRQYVLGNDGERVYGTGVPEGDAADGPVIIEPGEQRLPCPPSH